MECTKKPYREAFHAGKRYQADGEKATEGEISGLEEA